MILEMVTRSDQISCYSLLNNTNNCLTMIIDIVKSASHTLPLNWLHTHASMDAISRIVADVMVTLILIILNNLLLELFAK